MTSRRPTGNSHSGITENPTGNVSQALTATTMFPALEAGPWPAWAPDGEGRGFYYRSRISITGQMEWDFAGSSPSQTYRYLQATEQAPYFYYRTQPQTDFAPRTYQACSSQNDYMYHPGTTAASVSQSSSDLSDVTDESDEQESTQTPPSGFTIPAIIDVDMDNNVKVMIPNRKKGAPTIEWDNKHERSKKSKVSPGARVREWLQSESSDS